MITGTPGNPGLSTAEMDAAMQRDACFTQVASGSPGDIIISPTKTEGNHGHVGIVSHNDTVNSNDSNTCTWTNNYTIDNWTKKYTMKGLETKFYRYVC
jgi:hypothetical protein